MRIVFIGAGNLATQLAPALACAGHEILQVYSRTLQSAQTLGERLQCPFTATPADVVVHADLYIFSVKDSVLECLISQFVPKCKKALFVHTAGSMPMSVFSNYAIRFGVFYPMQTFSKTKQVDFSAIPIFIEASSPEELKQLKQLAQGLSEQVYALSSAQRGYLHLSAVFACNFANHCYALAQEILKEQRIPFEVMLPLIDETTAKIHAISPSDAQTGPAVRYDKNVINKHLDLLCNHPQLQELYQLMSESIYRQKNKIEDTTD